jgi:hypothetical protein
MVNELQATAAPVENVTELTTRSWAAVTPTDPSTTLAPVFLVNENHAAVPPAADESDVMVLAVILPPVADAKALVEGKVKAATTELAAVVALETSAGWAPA